MEKNNLLCIVMPTIDQYAMKNYWLPSVKNLKNVSEFCNICINFQKYPSSLMNEVLNTLYDLGFQVHFSEDKEYTMEKPGMLQFNKIRNDTANLNKDNCLIYCLTDDDFSYLPGNDKVPDAGEQYLRVIHYMLTFERCGFVLTGGAPYTFNPVNTIGLTRSFNNEWYATNKSLFLRSMNDFGYRLFPDDSLELYGAREECILCASRLNEGLFSAKFGNARVNHYENWKNNDITPGFDEFAWLKKEIVKENANKYIKDHYKTNIRGVHSFNVVREETFISKGGIEYNEENRMKYQIDYSTYSVDMLKHEINELLKRSDLL